MAIADTGSFAAAARHLRVAPSVATRAIAALETRLGVPLLRRTTRLVRLTEPGAAFAQSCRRLLGDLDDAEKVAAGAAAEPQGTLVITAPVTFGRLHVLPIVIDLLRHHSRLRARLMLVDRNVRLAEEGIDLALRIGQLADSSLHRVVLGQVRRVLVAAPAYLEAHGVPASPAELGAHATIAFTGIAADDAWRFGPEPAEVVPIRPRLVIDSTEAAIAAASAGLGIARVLSYQVQDAVAAGRLVRLELEEGPPLPVSLVFQAGRAGTPAVSAFIEAARLAAPLWSG